MTVSSRDQLILAISTKLDIATDVVLERIKSEFGGKVLRINTEEFPFESTLTLEPDGRLAFDGKECGDLRSVWYRKVRVPEQPPELSTSVYDYCIREARSALLGTVLALDAPFMSFPTDVWAAEHKAYQLKIARALGLTTPRSVITNNPDDVLRAFKRFNGEMIIKPIRSGYFEDAEGPKAIYTSQVLESHLSAVEDARLAPSIYQEMVPKDCDVRVTVVGEKMFVAEIDSQSEESAKVDWRKTADPNLKHRRASIPDSLQLAIRKLMRRLNLVFGALDFVRTPTGEYVFLEVNPNGQWLWIEHQLGYDISGEVAKWLISPPQL